MFSIDHCRKKSPGVYSRQKYFNVDYINVVTRLPRRYLFYVDLRTSKLNLIDNTKVSTPMKVRFCRIEGLFVLFARLSIYGLYCFGFNFSNFLSYLLVAVQCR